MMHNFHVNSGQLYCEEVSLETIVRTVGTPCYVYSGATLDARIGEYKQAFTHYPSRICYALKANSNLHLLSRIFAAGLGADIVSRGELRRALKAGATPNHIIYSGVGKTDLEIREALTAGIGAINVESLFELELINTVCDEMKVVAPIFLRLNFDVEAGAHHKIQTGKHTSKFGLPISQLPEALALIQDRTSLQLKGLSSHGGSQILDLAPIQKILTHLVRISQDLRQKGVALEYLDAGGGLGIRYHNEQPPTIAEYGQAVVRAVESTGLTLMIEPGRSLVAESGALVCSVLGIKRNERKNFVVVDGAMTELIRPTLYGAYHPLLMSDTSSGNRHFSADLVGPVCETGDILAENRQFPQNLATGDLVVVGCAGAYGSSMGSHYNSRPKPAEVLVDGDQFKIIRRQDSIESLWQQEI